MKKTNKILIALDYNPTAQKVAEAGCQLATSMNAQVIIMHVIADPAYYASTVYDPIMGFGGFVNLELLEADSIDKVKKTAQGFLDKSKEHLGDETIETITKEGDVAEAIIELAKEINADIIVMGSHSKKWLEQILMGSVTEEVLQQTTIPLFIIPTKKQN